MGNQPSSQNTDPPSETKQKSTMPPKDTIKVLDSFAAFANKNRIDDNPGKLINLNRLQDLNTKHSLLLPIEVPPTIVYDAFQNQILTLKKKSLQSNGFFTIYWQSLSEGDATTEYVSSQFRGNGTLISTNLVLTAASLIEQKDKKIDKITFCPGGYQEGVGSYREIEVKEWIVHPDYLNQTPGSPEGNIYDFAILVLEEDIGLKTGFAFYKNISNEELDGCQVGITGHFSEESGKKLNDRLVNCKRDKEITSDAKPTIYQASGKIISISDSKIKLKIEPEFCTIGSGIVLSTPLYENLIIGLFVETSSNGEHSDALRITAEILEWIESIETSNSYQRDRKIVADLKIQNKLLADIESINTTLCLSNPIHRLLVPLYVLGTGPRSCTYKVYDPFFKKFYALKRINLIDDKAAESVALKELKVMLKLAKFQTSLKDYRKNQFLNVYEIKYSPGEYITYLTELGIGTLSSYNHFRRTNKQPLSEDESTIILNQIYFHAYLLKIRRIFHRDIKPSNLIISEDCYIKLADFGISEYLEEGQNEFGSFPAAGTEGFGPEIIQEALKTNKKSVEIDLWEAEQEMICNTVKILYKDADMPDETINLYMKIKAKQAPEDQKLQPILNISEENRQLLDEFTEYKISHIIDKSNTINFLMVAKSLLDKANILEATNLINMLKPIAKYKKTDIDFIFLEAQVE